MAQPALSAASLAALPTAASLPAATRLDTGLAAAAPGGDVAATAPLHVVLNGAAGNQDDDAVLAALDAELGAAGRRHMLHRPDRPQDLGAAARRAAAAARADGGTVVAVGGDGTLNTVVAAVDGAAPCGLIPRGTFNYVARAHGIPLDAEGAVRLLVTGQPRPTPVARLNGRPFLVNASVGLYPELLQDREAFKARHGRSRANALVAALQSLLRDHRSLDVRIEADGVATRTLRISTLFVGHNTLQLASLGLPEADVVGGAALAAVVLRAVGRRELLWLALRGAVGRLGDADDVMHFPCRELHVAPRSRVPKGAVKVSLDGEVTRVVPPLVFGVDPRPLWLVRPPPGAAPA